MQSSMRKRIRYLTRAALIAAVYTLLTYVWPFSFGPVQVRISEALTALPILCPAAVPGLFAGCLLAGILSGAVWFDVVFGSLTTLLAAYLTAKFRKYPLPAMLFPVILNAVVVGAVVHFAYAGNPALSLLPMTMLTVGAGEAAACLALGYPMILILRRIPEEMWR